MRPFLCDADGNLCITPGVPSAAMVAESGVLWSDRKARVVALFESPPDDGDILPAGLVEALTATAHAHLSQGARQLSLVANAPAVPGVNEFDDGSARAAVLMAAVRHADDVTGRVGRQALVEHARTRDGQPVKPRTLTHVLTSLVADGVLLRVRNGIYELTDRARGEVSRNANALVAAMVGPDPVVSGEDDVEAGEPQ